MNLERYLFEGQVDELLGPERRRGLWRVARLFLQVARFVIVIPLLLPALAIFVVPTFALCVAPLLVPGMLWSLGGLAGAALWPDGGSIVGAAAFALLYSAVVARLLSGFLGSGAGWRYWAVVHEEGFPEIGLGLGGSDLKPPLTVTGVALDVVAAALFGIGGLIGGYAGWIGAGAGAFLLWGFMWGAYLSATRPRGQHYFKDIAGILPCNFFCLWGLGESAWTATPGVYPRGKLRWAFFCGLGYAVQASLAGLVIGVVTAQLEITWR